MCVLVVVAACAPAPTTSPAPTGAVLSATPSPSLSIVASTSSPGPSETHALLPEWRWTQGAVGDSEEHPITAIWALPKAFVATDTPFHEDHPSPSIFRTSTDGLHWTRFTFPERGFVAEHGVVLDGVLTMVGHVGTEGDPNRQIWTTEDGRAWHRVKGATGLDFGAGAVRALVHADAGWLAQGIEWLDAETARSHLLFSSELRAWTELDGPPDGVGGLASDGRRFMGMAAKLSDGPGMVDVLVSEDGRTWSRVHVAEVAKWEGADVIAGTPAGFAIAGQRFEPTDESSHPIGWASADGASWKASQFQGPAGPAGEAAPRVILSSIDGLIAHGNGDPLGDALWLSDDGAGWVQVKPLPELLEVDAYVRAGIDLIVAGPATAEGPIEIWRGTPVR